MNAKETRSLVSASSAVPRSITRRNWLIKREHDRGATIREIAAVCGLSSARIHQIIHNR